MMRQYDRERGIDGCILQPGNRVIHVLGELERTGKLYGFNRVPGKPLTATVRYDSDEYGYNVPLDQLKVEEQEETHEGV